MQKNNCKQGYSRSRGLCETSGAVRVFRYNSSPANFKTGNRLKKTSPPSCTLLGLGPGPFLPSEIVSLPQLTFRLRQYSYGTVQLAILRRDAEDCKDAKDWSCTSRSYIGTEGLVEGERAG